LRHDPTPPFPKLILRELTLLRRLASDRRTASAKMPTLMRTGPAVLPPVKPPTGKSPTIKSSVEPDRKPRRTTQRAHPGDRP
jgi:hypothetical protein